MYGGEKGINVLQNIPRNDGCLNPTEISMISCVRPIYDQEMSVKFAVELNLGQRMVAERYYSGLSGLCRQK